MASKAMGSTVFPLSEWLPYVVTRTWHVQAGLFWIATAWLAAGLFIGPLVSDYEPKGQRLGVNVLFGALLLVVVGSFAGEWLSVHNKMSDTVSFYFGHQGYEYVELGRVWQIALFIGLLLWLFLMLRVLWPAMRKPGQQKQLVILLAVASGAIALFYGAGLTWGHHGHLSMVEYWRWWVVHLWVEGFFEVFATTVIAFIFMRLNLIRPGLAAAAALLSATIFLVRRHHWYLSPFVFLRDTNGSVGLGLCVQRSGSRAAGSNRIRCLGRLASFTQIAMGAAI